MQWLDELLRNLDTGFKFFWAVNAKTLLGAGGGLVGLWLCKVGLNNIREAKEHGTAPSSGWFAIIVGGIIVLVMGIIVAIGVAEQYPQH